MGICLPSQYTAMGDSCLNRPPPSAKIIHRDGKLEEFRQPIKAGFVLSRSPNCFLCNSELMHVNSRLPHVHEDEQLQLDQIYFLMSQSKPEAPLSLQELCSLAIKASTALSRVKKAHILQLVLIKEAVHIPLDLTSSGS